MINKVATRIQSRLARKNIRVSLGNIKKVYSENVVNTEKPTDEEIDIITNHFVNELSKPTLSNDSGESDNKELGLTDDNISNEISNVDLTIEANSDNDGIVEISENPQETYQLAISNADKQSMITTQSAALGIELTEDEAASIANTIDDVFDDYASFLTQVTSAVKSYIAHKFDSIESELFKSSSDLKQYLADRNEQLNQKLVSYTNNVRSIQTDTQEIRDNLNKSKNAVLSRFRV